MIQAKTAVKNGKVYTIYLKENNKVIAKATPHKVTLLTWEAAEKWVEEMENYETRRNSH